MNGCAPMVTDEISIGDYVLSGGELAAMVIVDAMTRHSRSARRRLRRSSRQPFARSGRAARGGRNMRVPSVFRNEAAPDVLLSGHHGQIEQWRRANSAAHVSTAAGTARFVAALC